jgi:hypothetical protein
MVRMVNDSNIRDTIKLATYFEDCYSSMVEARFVETRRYEGLTCISLAYTLYIA